MGITLHSRKDKHPVVLPPKHTWARKTIKDVAEAGERAGNPDHIYDVLGMFMTTPVNRTQLHGETIYGVSKWMLSTGITTHEVPFLTPAFADVDLKMIRETVAMYRIPIRPPQIALLIAGVMHDAVVAIGKAD